MFEQVSGVNPWHRSWRASRAAVIFPPLGLAMLWTRRAPTCR